MTKTPGTLRKSLPSILLVVAACVFVAYAALVEPSNVSQRDMEGRASKLLPDLRPSDVTEMVIARPEGSVSLRREALDASAPFAFTSPMGERADEAATDTFLQELSAAELGRRVQGEPEAFGDELLRIELRRAKGTNTLRFGGIVPGGDKMRYVRVDGQVLVVSDLFAKRLIQTISEFRSTRMLRADLSSFSSIEVRAKTRSYRLVRGQNGDLLVDPNGFLAAESLVSALSTEVLLLRADRLLGEAAELSLSSTTATVRFEAHSVEFPSFELRLGGACSGSSPSVEAVVEATRAGLPLPRGERAKSVGCVPRGVLSLLLDTDPVEMRVLGLSADQVAELSISGPEGRVEVARKGKGYRARAPFDRDLTESEAMVADRLVRTLTEARSDRVVPAPPPDGPVYVVRATNGQGQTFELRGGQREPDGAVPIIRMRDRALLWLPARDAALLLPNAESLRPLSLLSARIERDAVLSYGVRCGEVVETVAYTPSGWQMQEPPDLPVDVPLAFEAISQLESAEVERWVPASELSGAPPFDGRCTVTLATKAASTTFEFVPREGHGDLGRIVGGTAFVSSPLLRENLTRWLVDRSVLAFPLERGARLVVQSGTASRGYRLARGQVILEAGDSGMEAGVVTALAAETATKLLRELRAAVAVSRGPGTKEQGLSPPAWTVTMVDEAGARLHSVAIGAPVEHRHRRYRYARADGVSATYLVDAETASELSRLLAPRP